MNVPPVICVVPFVLKSVPLLMFVILNEPISLPSTLLRAMTWPVVVCLLIAVVAFVTEGVSAIEWTLIEMVAVLEFNEPSLTL